MVKLPCAEAACCAAGLPDELIGVGLALERVEGRLHGAVDVVAEFAGFVFRVAFDRHGYRFLLPVGTLKSIPKRKAEMKLRGDF
jgi:hypothetical protein